MSNNFFSWCLPQIKDQPRDLGFGQVLFSLMFMPLTRRLTIVIFKAQHLKPAKEGFPGQTNMFILEMSLSLHCSSESFTLISTNLQFIILNKRGVGAGGAVEWKRYFPLFLVESLSQDVFCVIAKKKKGINFSVALSEGFLSFFFFSHLCWGCND